MNVCTHTLFNFNFQHKISAIFSTQDKNTVPLLSYICKNVTSNQCVCVCECVTLSPSF